MQKPAVFLAVCVLGMAFGSAEARQVCLPGTGLSCNDAAGSADPAPQIARRNQRIAAGMAAASELVNLLGVLIDIVDDAAPPEENERDVIRRLQQGERVEACQRAAAWEASGARQLRLGDYTSADAHLKAAVKYARDGHCDDAIDGYERNLNLAIAYEFMLSAVEMIGAKRYREAENQLMSAASHARLAGADNLERQIVDYRRGLHAKIGSGQPFKERTSCVEVNGQELCD